MADTALRGDQEPRYLSLPPADETDDYGDRAIGLAELAGLTLDPWQQLVLRGMLRRRSSRQWAAYECCLNCPRQNGKSLILEAYDLAKLYLGPPGTLILHSAHQFRTALETFRHLSGLIRNSPELMAEVKPRGIRESHGEESVELKNGSRLLFTARSVSGAGRGFSPDTVVLDEAYRLPHEALAALQPALAAKPNPQMVYASSTGYPDSEVLWSLVQRGRAGGDGSLAYFEWSADPSLALDDPRAWAQANPALGYRLTAEKTAAEWRSMKDARREDFARERLGLWAESKTASVFPAGTWDLCGDPASQIASMPMFAAAVSTDRTTASIGVAGSRSDGVQHLEVVQNAPGTDWIVPDLARMTARNGGSVVIDPGSPAGSLIDDLRGAGVRVHTSTARDYAQACGWVFDAVQNKELRHLDDPVLGAAVAAADLRTLAGGFAWDLRAPRADITPLVAVTLACWGHRTYCGDPSEAVW